MAELRWTPQAADDLEAITDFIALDSPHFASLFAIDTTASIEQLCQFPKLGRMVPEIRNPSIRELVLGNYRVVYRIKNDLVEILTIWHVARPLDLTKL